MQFLADDCLFYITLFQFIRVMLTRCNVFDSGCRADGCEAAIILLPSNITVFTLDFSGSGLSGGDQVTLGWNEVSAWIIIWLGHCHRYCLGLFLF